jgi:hypothetical protein
MSETIAEPTAVGKAWQKGIDLAVLKGIAQIYQRHDGDRPLGAFTKVKENAVAIWMSEGRLVSSPTAAVAFKWLKSRQQISDFTGDPALSVPAGALSIERAAGSAMEIVALVSSIADPSVPIVWRQWADHPEERTAARTLAMSRSATVIRASSEVLSVMSRGCTPIKEQLATADTAGIAPLSLSPDSSMQALLSQWAAIVERQWVDHYSSYNKRRSWAAVALKSFGGSPDFIEKPAEMSRKYQQEHPDRLEWTAADTPLFDILPGARDLLSSLRCDLERVRLMRLGGTGGELTRHADITDRDAGTRIGAIARLHLPLVTHPSVQFTTWNINNEPRTVHMTPDRWWYLDVRKPHMAINRSNFDRIHLVADCIVNPYIQQLITEAAHQ